MMELYPKPPSIKINTGLMWPQNLIEEGGSTMLEDERVWSLSGTSIEDTSLILTKDAEEGKRHYLEAFQVVVSGATLANDIIVTLIENIGQVDEKILWLDCIGQSAPSGTSVGVVFTKALPIELEKSISVKTDVGGGTGVYLTINMKGVTK